MEIQFKGGNCLLFSTKSAKLVVDNNLKDLGLKELTDKVDISVFTSEDIQKNNAAKGTFIINDPGEYEISGISVKGILTRSHMDEEGARSAIIYRLVFGTTIVVVTGHIYPELSDKQLEEIGMVDILAVPVGGNGYTLDAQGAEKVIKKLDPKIVIPTHYAESGVEYEVPQNSLDEFLRVMSLEAEETDKLKLKNDIFPENLSITKLKRA